VETRLFDYALPDERIAQHPAGERDASRLFVVGRGESRHAAFRDWAELVPEGALVVLNDTRVTKARILGTREGSGGKVELLLIRRKEGEPGAAAQVWLAMGRANRSLRPGTRVESGPLRLEIEGSEEGLLRVRVHGEGGVETALERAGHVPLPPYVRRADVAADVERYQTIFAREPGSAAAPTAGLHVSEDTLATLRARDVRLGYLTLHVGLGTFQPVTAPDLDAHRMHAEVFEVGKALAQEVAAARERQAPVVAVGTTVVRALESAREPGEPRYVRSTAGQTSLLIQPGYAFGPVDALLTNFHAPRSTLLALVSAFAGRERIAAAYAEAIASGYRFLSYGDAMWIPERLP